MLKHFHAVALLSMASVSLLGLKAPAQNDEPADSRRPAAQQPSRPADPTDARRDQAQQGHEHGRGLDAKLVALVIPGNQGEIALAKIAEERSQNPQIKKFAQQMQQEHSQFAAKLERFAGNDRAGDNASERRENATDRRDNNRDNNEARDGAATPRERLRDANRPAATAVREGVDVEAGGVSVRTGDAAANEDRGQRMDGRFNFVNFHRQVAQRCLASSRRELESKQGAEFDKCYIGMQLAAHQHMIDLLEVEAEYASPELQQVLRDGSKTAQQHLQHAKQIMQQLESTNSQASR